MTGSCPTPGELLEYSEGVAGEREARVVERHVSECDECSRRLREVKAIVGPLRSLGAACVSPGVCVEGERVAAYADGSLSSAAAREAERHISGCPACLCLLADLWLPHGIRVPASSRRVEERVVTTLERESRTAVVAWARGVATLVRGFGAAVKEAEDALNGGALEPAAVARGASCVRFEWTGADGVRLECEVRDVAGCPSLVGRVTTDGVPSRSLSAALRGRESRRGPESLDDRGRFGPWPLEGGENAIVLSGNRLPGGRVELAVELREG